MFYFMTILYNVLVLVEKISIQKVLPGVQLKTLWSGIVKHSLTTRQNL